MSENSTPNISQLTDAIDIFITDQKQKIDFLTDIVKEIKEKGSISTISDDKLALITTLNLKDTPEAQLDMMDFRPPQEKPKFLSMVATTLDKISPSFGFIKENNFNWYNLSYKLGLKVKNISNKISQKNISYIALKEGLEEKTTQLEIKIKQSKVFTSTTNAVEEIILIGKKKNIHKLNKKFKQDLALIGFEAEDFYQYSDKSYLTVSEVADKATDKLSKKISLTKIDNKYNFSILEDLKDDRKFDMISKVIWPTLSKELSQNLSLAFAISETLNNQNKDIKSLVKFSNKNNIHTDTIIHALKHNPDMLSDYPGYQAILNDKENILKSANKYDALVENNTMITKILVGAASQLKSELELIKSPQATEFIKDINSYIIGSKKNKIGNEAFFTLSTLERNILSLSEPEKEIESKMSPEL